MKTSEVVNKYFTKHGERVPLIKHQTVSKNKESWGEDSIKKIRGIDDSLRHHANNINKMKMKIVELRCIQKWGNKLIKLSGSCETKNVIEQDLIISHEQIIRELEVIGEWIGRCSELHELYKTPIELFNPIDVEITEKERKKYSGMDGCDFMKISDGGVQIQFNKKQKKYIPDSTHNPVSELVHKLLGTSFSEDTYDSMSVGDIIPYSEMMRAQKYFKKRTSAGDNINVHCFRIEDLIVNATHRLCKYNQSVLRTNEIITDSIENINSAIAQRLRFISTSVEQMMNESKKRAIDEVNVYNELYDKRVELIDSASTYEQCIILKNDKTKYETVINNYKKWIEYSDRLKKYNILKDGVNKLSVRITQYETTGGKIKRYKKLVKDRDDLNSVLNTAHVINNILTRRHKEIISALECKNIESILPVMNEFTSKFCNYNLEIVDGEIMVVRNDNSPVSTCSLSNSEKLICNLAHKITLSKLGVSRVKLIIIDECFSSLDEKRFISFVRDITTELKDVFGNVLLIEHRGIEELCDTVYSVSPEGISVI
jgi:hypothetical protein